MTQAQTYADPHAFHSKNTCILVDPDGARLLLSQGMLVMAIKDGQLMPIAPWSDLGTIQKRHAENFVRYVLGRRLGWDEYTDAWCALQND